MTTTTPIVPQAGRGVNTSPATRHKARRLAVTTITQQAAFVRGDHDTYMVAFDGLTCTCKAAAAGMRCSHVLAAIEERAKLQGWEGVLFLGNAREVAAAQGYLSETGSASKLYTQHGYLWLCYGDHEVDHE